MTKKWEDLTPAQRRVAIAKDVIAQIGNGAIAPAHCYYKVFDEDLRLTGNVSADKAREIQSCGVCALGALMLSRIAKFNNATWDELVRQNIYGPSARGREAVESKLRGAFTVKMMASIEEAYEDFWLTEDDHDRLLAIMQNIVDHDGTFRPEVEYEVIEQ